MASSSETTGKGSETVVPIEDNESLEMGSSGLPDFATDDGIPNVVFGKFGVEQFKFWTGPVVQCKYVSFSLHNGIGMEEGWVILYQPLFL